MPENADFSDSDDGLNWSQSTDAMNYSRIE